MKRTIIQQQNIKKAKAVVDIVFCIDASGSMRPCLEGVKEHVNKFLDGIASNQQLSAVDWRLGLVAHDSKRFYLLDFTNELNKFRSSLQKVQAGGNEFTFPALDWSLDFPWRNNAHRIVVLFTDEPLEGGYDPDFQRSQKNRLFKKIQDLRIMVYFVGPECPEYKEVNQLPRCSFEPIREHTDFFKVGFEKVLERIGRTISGSIISRQQMNIGNPPKDIYGIKNSIRIIKL